MRDRADPVGGFGSGGCFDRCGGLDVWIIFVQILVGKQFTLLIPVPGIVQFINGFPAG